MDQPTLRGTRVTLRPWTAADADFVYDTCQDAEIQRWTTVPSPYLRDDAVGYVTDVAASAWRDGGGVFAVCAGGAGGMAVGAIGAHGMRDGVAHVGYWTAVAARGGGLTSDALRTLSRWFLEERGAARVELVIEPGNAASLGVAHAAGFVREGVLRQRLVLRGRRTDVVMFSLLATDVSGA